VSIDARDSEGPYIAFDEARALVEHTIAPLPPRRFDLTDTIGLVLAADAIGRVDSPSVDASARDGFAVRSADLVGAGAGRGVRLAVIGSATAGVPFGGRLRPGTAVRITTGAPLPAGADAAVMSEFCQTDGQEAVVVGDDPGPGRNLIPRGNDVRAGHVLAAAGTALTPGTIGLLAAAGLDRVQAHPLPRVALLAVGDEVVAPGGVLGEGQLYASNLAFLDAWLRQLGIDHTAAVIKDDRSALRGAIEHAALAESRVVITTGGAWSSHRDMVIPVLDELGWTRVFRRVRMGPGTGTALGVLFEQIVICLPGGPPSSAVGFLELALPGLLRLAGRQPPYLQIARAWLSAPVVGRRPGFTEFAHGRLNRGVDGLTVEPLQRGSRLARIAAADCLMRIDAGTGGIPAGTEIEVELLAVRP
jgi:molybdopterin molybdotransferase